MPEWRLAWFELMMWESVFIRYFLSG